MFGFKIKKKIFENIKIPSIAFVKKITSAEEQFLKISIEFYQTSVCENKVHHDTVNGFSSYKKAQKRIYEVWT